LIKFSTTIIGILIISFLVRVLRRSLSRYIRNPDASYRFRKLVTFVGYLIIALFITVVFSDRLGQLTVVFGVIGAGIAFALQEVVASFAGWVAISLGDFYNPGDRVQLGGIIGDVIDIRILRTTVMELGGWVRSDLYNGRIVRIANSCVFKEPVYNYSADFPFVWDEITVPIKYGGDRQLTRQILQRTVEDVVGDYIPAAQAAWKKMVHKYLIEDGRIEPLVTLVANDNWMEFTVRYVVDYKQRRGKKDELFSQILDEFDRTEGRVEIASTTVHLVQAPALNVQLSDGGNGWHLSSRPAPPLPPID
jgi:small-conductance mechanosensitive channel